MARLIANLVINLTEGIQKIQCKYGMIIDKAKRVKSNTKVESNFLRTQMLKVI